MAETSFPSLVVHKDRLEAQGSFAESQAQYLDPDPRTVQELDTLVRQKNAGIVAHYYMAPELQGVLARLTWPHVHISDSLLMADKAVAMVEGGASTPGAERIVVLGVDFMSENARAMLDKAGHRETPVYRVAADPIGCSLAEAAESSRYLAFLDRAASVPRALHVVYINTSLRTKAEAHARVPTITVTSSNVVNTILTAFAEIPDVEVFFGPDTYMGRNLANLFRTLTTLGDAAVKSVHPAHDVASITRLLERFHFFDEGHCIVHHMFGAEVAERVRTHYPHAYVTAHLEVPGEMFELALAARREGRGVVGSTSDILTFITTKIRDAAKKPEAATLSFVLGTETGMVTSIVGAVQAALRETGRDDVACEIVFPVASEAITRTNEPNLLVVPGVAGGEGCSVEGGCATCPYMKMNSLDALFDLLRSLPAPQAAEPVHLKVFHPNPYEDLVAGRTIADLGGEPILHMRGFQKSGHIPPDLHAHVTSRVPAPPPGP
ncbi:MAG: quinolinate synthase NadA [Deltaproteobacteria bacterium]|nr:quinolinate synthase NadA [Deltaproteobacteria bacterium]